MIDFLPAVLLVTGMLMSISVFNSNSPNIVKASTIIFLTMVVMLVFMTIANNLGKPIIGMPDENRNFHVITYTETTKETFAIIRYSDSAETLYYKFDRTRENSKKLANAGENQDAVNGEEQRSTGNGMFINRGGRLESVKTHQFSK